MGNMSEFRRRFETRADLGRKVSMNAFRSSSHAGKRGDGEADTGPVVEQLWARDAIATARSVLNPARSGVPLAQYFRKLDLAHDGTLLLPEFENMMMRVYKGLTRMQLRQLFTEINTSGSGRISLAEFSRFFG